MPAGVHNQLEKIGNGSRQDNGVFGFDNPYPINDSEPSSTKNQNDLSGRSKVEESNVGHGQRTLSPAGENERDSERNSNSPTIMSQSPEEPFRNTERGCSVLRVSSESLTREQRVVGQAYEELEWENPPQDSIPTPQ